jgi:hypothetical protein
VDIDDDKVKGDVDSHKSGGRFHKLEEGPNYVRVIPPLEGLVQPGTYYGLHHVHGLRSEGAFRTVRCLRDKDWFCPLCAMGDFFRQFDDDDNKKRARNCYSNAKYFLNVILGSSDTKKKVITADEDAGIVMLQISNALFEKCDNHRHGEWGDFTDPDEGYWLNIHGEGSGAARRYPNVSPSRFSMGALPKWVDYDDAHDLTADALVGSKTTREMVMICIDRYGDVNLKNTDEESVSVEGILKVARESWKGSKKRR